MRREKPRGGKVLMPRPSKERDVLKAFYESDRDKSVAEIADKTGLTRRTVNNHIDMLLANGDIEKTREVGNADMYEITWY